MRRTQRRPSRGGRQVTFTLGLIIGLIVGAPLGILILALMIVAAGADQMNDHERHGYGSDK